MLHGAAEDELWAAVSEPIRRRLLDILLERGEATATALAGDLPITRQAVVKHLAVLERAGLVASERRGRELRFAVQPERLDTAAEAMARVAATWDRRLERIKRLAEAAHAEQQAPGESAGDSTSRSRSEEGHDRSPSRQGRRDDRPPAGTH